MKPETWKWMAIGSGAALIAGSFMAWVKIGFIQANGTQGDGWFTIVGGVLALLFAFKVGAPGRYRGLLIVGVLMAALLVYEFVNIASTEGPFGISPSYGEGLYICSAGAIGTVIASVKRPTGESPASA